MPLSAPSPFPTPSQELLLKASLFSGEAMLEAWHQWRNTVNFETGVDPGSLRLLPLAFHNLYSHAPDNPVMQDPVMQRMKGIYRKAWSRNHFLFRKTARVLDFLQGHGIPTMVLKGIPMTLLVYRNHAVRPMYDMDVMVPLSQAEQALEMLKNEGWAVRNPRLQGFLLKFGRSIDLMDGEGDELDLHWHPVFETHSGVPESDFWDHSVSLEVAGVKTRSLSLADQLFLTLVHGLRCNIEPPIRWVPDAMALMCMPEGSLDWDRLVKQTTRYRVVLQVRNALAYLVRHFEAPVPAMVLQTLNREKTGWTDRLVYRHALQMGDLSGTNFRQRAMAVYAGYIRQSEKRGFLYLHLGFIRYALHLSRGRSRLKLFAKYLMLLFSGKPIKKAHEE